MIIWAMTMNHEYSLENVWKKFAEDAEAFDQEYFEKHQKFPERNLPRMMQVLAYEILELKEKNA